MNNKKSLLDDILSERDPNYHVDPEAEALLLAMVNDFLRDVTTYACEMCIHRESDTLSMNDINLSLVKRWGMDIPNISNDLKLSKDEINDIQIDDYVHQPKKKKKKKK